MKTIEECLDNEVNLKWLMDKFGFKDSEECKEFFLKHGRIVGYGQIVVDVGMKPSDNIAVGEPLLCMRDGSIIRCSEKRSSFIATTDEHLIEDEWNLPTEKMIARVRELVEDFNGYDPNPALLDGAEALCERLERYHKAFGALQRLKEDSQEPK